MTTETSSAVESANEPLKPKRIIERSASYPSIDLEEAANFTTEVLKHFPIVGQVVNREDVAGVLSKVVATIQRDIAAASQFGFFIKQSGEGYQISPLSKTLRNSLDLKEKRKLLLQAFASPKLYADIIEKFDGHVVPVELKTHLIRFHKIAEKAAPEAAEKFIKSALYCGALTQNRILQYKQEVEKVSDPNFQFAEVTTEQEGQSFVTENGSNAGDYLEFAPAEQVKPNNQLIIPPVTNTEEKLKVPLTDKKTAYIVYPSNINSKDIEILKKQIEVLQILVT